MTEILGFGILSLILLYFAKRGGYFAMQRVEWKVPLKWFHIVIVFIIYFATVFLFVPLMNMFMSSWSTIAKLTWLNFLSSIIALSLIMFFSLFLPHGTMRKIWIRTNQSHYFKYLRFAFLSFVIGFPLVIFFNDVLDFFLTWFFNIQELPEQLAVRFLKMTFQYPLFLIFSIITIVALAPMLEEILFRGFLQTYLRQTLDVKWAILISSFCFSLFHYSPDQGIANISIVGSLFVFALFLGYAYEKQGSLITSIALHALFNGMSVLNLYLWN